MPNWRASSRISRLGYIPGSWVSTPARKAAGVVSLQPRRLIGGQRECGGMGLAETEGSERFEHFPDPLDGRQVVSGPQRRRHERGAHLLLKVGITQSAAGLVGLGERTSWSSAPRSAAPARGRRRPRRYQRDKAPDRDAGNAASRQPWRASRKGRHHVALHRAGPEKRDVDDDVFEGLRRELADQLTLTGRLDLEAAEGAGGLHQRRRSPGRPGRSASMDPSIAVDPLAPPQGHGRSPTACGCPSRSSLSKPRSSTSSLSNWLIGKPRKLASTGVRSSRVRSDSRTPQGCSAMWRGSPSSRSTSRSSRSSLARRTARWSATREARRIAARTWLARMCGNALATASISPGAARARRRHPGSHGGPGRCPSSRRRRTAPRHSGRGLSRTPRCAGPTRRRYRHREADGAAATGTAPSAGRIAAGRRPRRPIR